MTEEEMEYEGGWLNLLVSAVCVGVDILATGMAEAGMIDKDLAKGISVAATAVGAAASFGITTAVLGGVKVVGEKTVECTVKNVAKWGVKEVAVKSAATVVSVGNTVNYRGSNKTVTWATRVISLC